MGEQIGEQNGYAYREYIREQMGEQNEYVYREHRGEQSLGDSSREYWVGIRYQSLNPNRGLGTIFPTRLESKSGIGSGREHQDSVRIPDSRSNSRPDTVSLP